MVVCSNGCINVRLDIPAVIRECELMVNCFHHSRSSAGVGVEDGRQEWSMKMVDGHDVGCRTDDFLSCFCI